MEQTIMDFISTLDKKSFKRVSAVLKDIMLEKRQYGLASSIKDMEEQKFPVNEKYLADYGEAENIELLARMLEIQIPDLRSAWLLNRGILMFKEMGGNFSLNDAAKLIAESHEIFD